MTEFTSKSARRRQYRPRPGAGWSRERLRVIAADPAWTPDLVVLSTLLVLTAMFGRPFSKLRFPGAPIYVTEVALAVVVVLLLRRVGVRAIVSRTRATIPLYLLLLLWVAGGVATIRGLATYGLDQVTHDVGLIEYSVVLPLVVAVADTPARRLLVFRVLVAAGLVAAVVFAFVYFVPALADSRIGLRENGGSSVGLYLSLFALPVLAGVVEGIRRPRWMLPAAVGVLVLMSLTVQRSAILALATALVVLVALARRKRRAVAAAVAIAALVVSVGGAAAIQHLDLGTLPPGLSDVELTGAGVSAAADYATDDEASAFAGGVIVRGDGAAGGSSHQIARGERAELQEVRDLIPGKVYTIVFWLKPLGSVVAHGRVGDTWSGGWGPVPWTAAPSSRWQRFQKHLRATRTTDRLAIELQGGPAALRFDDVQIIPRELPGPSGDFRPKAAPAPRRTPVPPTTTTGQEEPPEPAGGGSVKIEQRKAGNPLVAAFRGTFDPNSVAGAFNENERWRLSFWRFMLRETFHHPVAGVGFGTPSDFVWRGVRYDARQDPSDVNDVTPPHNSFVNLVYRTGLLGALPFFALVGIGLVRLGRALSSARTVEVRSRLVASALIGVSIGVAAFFNGALEGPFMGIFFWTVLGLFFLSYPVQASER